MKKGKVKRFNPQTGSGEIKPDKDSRLIGFNKSAIKGDIKQIGVGAKIEYEDDGNPYAPKAKQVVIDTPAPERMAGNPVPPNFSAKSQATSPRKGSISQQKRHDGPTGARSHRYTSQDRGRHGQQKGSSTGSGEFPYDFVLRDPEKSRKHKPDATHEKLLTGRYDVAFEIEWENLTPIAANPCSEGEDNAFPHIKDGYKGYSKRWLIFDDKGNKELKYLAISPFTVKSAIANGFANIMGSCFRVNRKKEGHKDTGKGKYLYGGRYKRYRVAMDGSSKPGIVTYIQDVAETGDKIIKVIPVKEFYANEDLPSSLKLTPGKELFVKVLQDRGHKPPIIDHNDIEENFQKGYIKVKYHSPYKCGMGGTPHKSHKKRHRFYQECGIELSGRIPAINFIKDREKLKEYVCIGGADPEGNPKEWFQALDDIEKDSFVYFETFDGKITNIGKNFLFKALFLHEDIVLETNRECEDIFLLCPRCSMFGMTDKSENEERGVVGFKGRFKASALVNKKKLKYKPGVKKCSVTVFENGKFTPEEAAVTSWVDDTDNTICMQYPLPIQGEPKPNKRDSGGYYDKNTGVIEGAKYYYHAMVDINRLVLDINEKKELNEKGEPKYSHQLRNFAEVVFTKEAFTGNVGAENCSVDEVAAFIILLRSDIANHGFKIGLGKAFGMGSISSTIKTIWIRKPDNYDKWIRIDNIDKMSVSDLKDILDEHFKGIKKELAIHEKIKAKLNSLELMDKRKLTYPMPVQSINNRNVSYWDLFKRQGR